MQLYLFTHEFRFIEIGKRYVRVGMILKRSCVGQLEEEEERCDRFDRSNRSVDAGQIFASMV